MSTNSKAAWSMLADGTMDRLAEVSADDDLSAQEKLLGHLVIIFDQYVAAALRERDGASLRSVGLTATADALGL